MQIDLLFFDGCPAWQEALENLKTALRRIGAEADIRLIQVNDDTHAQALKFLGSPSFQVNGQDLWPEERQDYHLSCRLYPTPTGRRGVPSVAMLLEKLNELFA